MLNSLKSRYALILQICIWLGLLGLWQILSQAGVLNSAFIPSPTSILNEFTRLNIWQVFAVDAVYTLSRMIAGLVGAYLLVLVLIYLSITSRQIASYIDQIRSVVKFLPPPVLIPLAILGVGINNTTVVSVVFASGALLMLNFAFTILQKEVESYSDLFDSWNISKRDKFIHFFLPISHYLSYRFIANLIIWGLSITIFTEIVIGSSRGFGPRLIQLQQLYQSSSLFALIIGIILVAYGCERILVYSLSRFRMDAVRTVSMTLVITSIIFSIGFQSYLGINQAQQEKSALVISTYAATLNLPLFVYVEKFNTINASIQITGSGIQSIDNLVAGRAVAGGYADLPNALSALSQNTSLRIISQTEEQPKKPLLYMISHQEVSKGNYKALSGKKIGYYPNNPIIEKGLDITLLLGGAGVANNEYVSSNDPSVLSQSFVSNQLDALVTIEPYAATVEKQTGLKRVNQDLSLIDGISFESLPLAGLVINPDLLTKNQRQDFADGLEQSLAFIENNTRDNKAIGELADIMKKYNLDTDSFIPYFSYGPTLLPQNLTQILNLIKLYDPQIGKQIADIDTEKVYY